MENKEKIFIEIDKKELNELDYTISDIICFVKGLEAAQGEYDERFNILIKAANNLRDFRNLINKNIREIRNGK